MLSRSIMSDSLQCLGLLALQAPLSMGFSRQEYWGALPFPSPGNLPNKGIEPVSPALAGRYFTEHLGSPSNMIFWLNYRSEKLYNFFQNSYFYISKNFYALLLMICISLTIKYIYNLFCNSYQIYGESSHCFVVSIYFNKNFKFSFRIFNL